MGFLPQVHKSRWRSATVHMPWIAMYRQVSISKHRQDAVEAQWMKACVEILWQKNTIQLRQTDRLRSNYECGGRTFECFARQVVSMHHVCYRLCSYPQIGALHASAGSRCFLQYKPKKEHVAAGGLAVFAVQTKSQEGVQASILEAKAVGSACSCFMGNA